MYSGQGVLSLTIPSFVRPVFRRSVPRAMQMKARDEPPYSADVRSDAFRSFNELPALQTLFEMRTNFGYFTFVDFAVYLRRHDIFIFLCIMAVPQNNGLRGFSVPSERERYVI